MHVLRTLKARNLYIPVFFRPMYAVQIQAQYMAVHIPSMEQVPSVLLSESLHIFFGHLGEIKANAH